MRAFDLGEHSLEPGRYALEASAGSGKTYSLIGLTIRLLVEKGLSCAQLLLVTFTRAAAAELREKLRHRLATLLAASPEDRARDEACAGSREGQTDDAVEGALQKALGELDEAVITTFHGLCQHILTRYPLESGFPPTQAVSAEIRAPAVRAFTQLWGTLLRRSDPLTLAFLGEATEWKNKLLHLATVQSNFGAVAPHPSLEQTPDFPTAQEELKRHWNRLRQALQDEGAALADFLSAPVFNRPPQRLKRSAAAWHRELGRLVAYPESRDCTSSPAGALYVLSAEYLEAKLKKDETLPALTTFPHATQFLCSVDQLQRGVWQFLVRGFEDARHAVQRDSDQVSYDDLVRSAVRAVESPRHPGLRERLRRQWRAGLVDEFQDTDPWQWRLLDTIFSRPDQHLYLVGDPKQAIYGFRGADLDTYLSATGAIPARFYLQRNWRSGRRLVTAINHFFASRENFFGNERIPYRPQEPVHDDDDGPALRLHQPDDATPRSNDAARRDLARRVAEAIAQDRAASDPPHPLHDYAVLATTRAEAVLVARELRRRGLEAALQLDLNVFHSSEAVLLSLLLHALRQLPRTGFLRTALASSVLRGTALSLSCLDTDESLRERTLAPFLDARYRWRETGVRPSLEGLFRALDLPARALAQPGGKRSLTNFAHLLDLLQAEEHRTRAHARALVRWFDAQRRRPESEDETLTERPSATGGAVTVLTAHKSKGLEFPRVFSLVGAIPTGGQTNPVPAFPNPAGGRFIAFPDDATKAEAKSQEASLREEESRRLLYVALTRARVSCHVFLAPLQKPENATLPALFADPDGNMGKAVEDLAASSAGAITVVTDPSSIPHASPQEVEEPVALAARSAPETVRPAQTLTSFSRLLANPASVPWEAGGRESDEPVSVGPITRPEDDPFVHLPAGTALGNAIHALLENLAPDQLEHLSDQQIEKSFASEGLPVRHDLAPIRNVLRRALTRPLWPGMPPGGLADTANEILRETPFALRLAEGALAQLEDWMTAHNLALHATGPARRPTADGYLRGVIDLLVACPNGLYVIDWKTNLLPAYDANSLTQAMAHHGYNLQASLYLRALAAHVRTIPEAPPVRGFAWVFLRGLQESGDAGVFFREFSEDDLTALERVALDS